MTQSSASAGKSAARGGGSSGSGAGKPSAGGGGKGAGTGGGGRPGGGGSGPSSRGGGKGGGPSDARAAVGGWLEGPRTESTQDEWAYRGQRLGLPESGPGSLAGQGRRLGALVVDWVIAELIALAFGWHPSSAQGQWGTIAIFGAEHLVLLSLWGATLGKRLFGLRVGKLGGPLTPLHVIMRTVLLLLVVPAVIWDRDGRGLHDRLAGTVEIRA
ncbi:RDD family protein [Actinocrinis sp.]|uniref:RDD family protein n=1 Tax=Actinocrinis sp. TaxID=1920516 RepID=UPI002D7379EB|nr:RDD family protein [Actinocrinis sp.]HZP52488.1 RDD family protein [Actinocrinis sp.]